MNRNGLKLLIRRWLAAAAAPLAIAGCGDIAGTKTPCPKLPYQDELPLAADAGLLDGGVPDGGPLPLESCKQLCTQFVGGNSGDVVSCSVIDWPRNGVPDGGTTGKAVECNVLVFSPCGTGRRPAGLVSDGRVATSDEVADHLAQAAHLEAAAVLAFESLAEELSHHGAPAELIARARASAREERGHARAVGRLARRRGAEPVAPRVEPRAVRDLEAIAVENAVEGCVGETWGAVLAARQAQAATDVSVRRVMTRIADEEARHADLAWDLDRWIRPLLDGAARARVDEARAGARAALRRQICGEAISGETRATLGLPSTAEALRLLGMMEGELLAA